jgi:hypothetical protein
MPRSWGPYRTAATNINFSGRSVVSAKFAASGWSTGDLKVDFLVRRRNDQKSHAWLLWACDKMSDARNHGSRLLARPAAFGKDDSPLVGGTAQ